MKQYIAISILLKLMDGKLHTSKELMEKFEVSKKTIFRSIEMLNQSSIPITAIPGRNGGYKICDHNRIETCSFFTIEELSYFFSFLRSNYNSIISDDNFNIKERFRSSSDQRFVQNINLRSQELIFDSDNWGKFSNKEINLVKIKNAISDRNKMKITYNSGKNQTKRIIHPYSLVYKNSIWYVYAYCEMKNDFRLFKLSKISDNEISDEKFIRKDIDCTQKPWNNDFEKNFKEIEIDFCVNKDYINEIEDWIGRNYTIYKVEKEILFAKTKTLFFQGLISKMLELGDKITIISPDLLRQEILNQCKNIQEKYTS